MSNTVQMTATALREIMGEAFDYDLYERGRQETRKLLKENPEARKDSLENVRRKLESGSYRHNPGPSYWVGCLCEFDFTWNGRT